MAMAEQVQSFCSVLVARTLLFAACQGMTLNIAISGNPQIDERKKAGLRLINLGVSNMLEGSPDQNVGMPSRLIPPRDEGANSDGGMGKHHDLKICQRQSIAKPNDTFE
ncbi:hypothetical protein FIBSPDRAFT_896847 [Athelia psychrophila]|uniref:Uncharacterized protein n=1 Tax=Athelia psychrophila TaxID=1759441 RepID=A0A166CXZ8_9AGAM|nr:hypothetical protein FIBSPDRAFT_896847 [Fibularhizoctonia sp. CBS 109695]